MSIYFADKPEYFTFLSVLESETERYKKVRGERLAALQKQNINYMKTKERAFASLNAGTRKPRYLISRSSLPRRNTYPTTPVSLKSQQPTIIMPSTHLSRELPTRKNNAKRIYEPNCLKTIQHEMKDEPVVIGKTFSVSSFPSTTSEIFSENI